MKPSHNIFNNDTNRALTRFLSFFLLFYTVSVLTLASLGVFESVQASSEPEEMATQEDEEDSGDEESQPTQMDDDDDTTLSEEEAQEVAEEALEEPAAEETVDKTVDTRVPQTISAPAVGLNANIVNPRSRDEESLNRALRDGVVYYPGSGYLGEDGNMFLFGHSSELPVVVNQNYKVFNRIKELEYGDPVYLEVDGIRYTYRVDKNYEAKDHEVVVDFVADEQRLTLATCNVFGAKEDRYIVEAVLARKEKVR